MGKYILAGIGFIATLFVGLAVTSGTDVLAQAGAIQDGVNSISTGQSKPLMETVGDLINVFLFLLGAVAVIMVIFGGFKYVTSAGDSSAVSSAKNTILYAVIGLVVAASAFAIVNFALGRFNTSDAPESTSAPTEQIRNGVVHQ